MHARRPGRRRSLRTAGVEYPRIAPARPSSPSSPKPKVPNHENSECIISQAAAGPSLVHARRPGRRRSLRTGAAGVGIRATVLAPAWSGEANE